MRSTKTANPLTDSSGNQITAEDDSDSGANPNDSNAGGPGDTGGTNDPTPLYLPNVGLAKVAGDAVANGDNFDVEFTLVYENNGTVDLANLTLFDDVAAQFGNAYVSTSGLSIQNFVGTGTAPGANAAWNGDNTLNLFDGTGRANIGDSFEITFTATIDPDGIDAVSQGLENQAVAGGDGLDENGDLLTDDSGNPVTVTDVSDDGTDPSGENGVDNGDGTFGNDPTPIIIADISVAKEVFGTPVALDDGTFEVTYQLVIENIGTVDLNNLSLSDDIAAQFGAPFVSASGLTLVTGPTDPGSSVLLDAANWDGNASTEMIDQAAATSLVVGDSYVVQFVVIVDLDAGGTSGPLENQVVAGGDAVDGDGNPFTDSNGNAITANDLSDSGADANGDNPNDQGDNGTSDDPTPLLIPDVSIVKSAGVAVANGDNWDVTFTLIVENTGTVTLNNLSLTDDIAAEFGNALLATSGLAIQNFAGTGTAPTANTPWTNDTTLNMLVGGSLDVGDSFEVVFTTTLDPDGIDSVSQGLTNQADVSGQGVNPDGSPLTDANGNPVLADDTSDNGTDPNGENGEDNGDGIAANDPTPILIADLSLAKAAVGSPQSLANGNFGLTYQLVVENTGTVDLADLSLLEDLASQFGGGFVSASGLTITSPTTGLSSTIALSSSWDGISDTQLVDGSASSLLEIGDSFTLEFDVEVNSRLLPADPTNTVSGDANAVDADGNPIANPDGSPLTAMDDSDSGTDPSNSNIGAAGDTFGSDDPTPLQIPSVGLAKSSGDAVPNGENFDVTFTIVFVNDGTVALNDLTLTDNIAAQLGDAAVDISDLTVANFVGTGTAPAANLIWESDSSQSLITGGSLNVGDSFEVSYTVTIDPDATGTSESLINQATGGGNAVDANGDPIVDSSGQPLTASDVSDNGIDPADENQQASPDGTFGNDPTPILIADLGIAKSVVGEPEFVDGAFLVTFQAVIENTGTVDLTNLSLIEDIATQFGTAFEDAHSLTVVASPSDPGSSIAVNSAFNGASDTELLDVSANNVLQVGDSFAIQFVVEIATSAENEVLENQIIGTGDAIDENGNLITDSSGDQLVAFDASDSGVNPNAQNGGVVDDNGTAEDSTLFTVPQNGASGNPPRFPSLPPLTFNRLSTFIGSPGPIYSGIPTNTSNPVTLDSNRPIGGGYGPVTELLATRSIAASAVKWLMLYRANRWKCKPFRRKRLSKMIAVAK